MKVASDHTGLVGVLFVCCLGQLASAGPAPSNEAIYLRGHASLTAELTIGGGPDEGDSPPPFYRPRAIDFATDGRIYVLDAETCEVVVFNPAGGYRSRFAREGEGPGELRNPLGMAIDRVGNVMIYESGNKRFSWFSADGEFIAAKRFDDGALAPRVRFASGEVWRMRSAS